MKTLYDLDISELMRIINYQMSENQKLKSSIAELKGLETENKKLSDKIRVLKIEKNRLLQKNTYLIRLATENHKLKIDKKELRKQLKNFELKGIRK